MNPFFRAMVQPVTAVIAGLVLIAWGAANSPARADQPTPYYYRLKSGPAIQITWPEKFRVDTRDVLEFMKVDSIGSELNHKFRIRNQRFGKPNLANPTIDLLWETQCSAFDSRILRLGDEFTVKMESKQLLHTGPGMGRGTFGLYSTGTAFEIIGTNPKPGPLDTRWDMAKATVGDSLKFATREVRFRVRRTPGKTAELAFVMEGRGDLVRCVWEVVEGQPPEAVGQDVKAFVRQGEEAHRNKDWRKMADAYRGALKLAPNTALYWNELGTAFWELKDYAGSAAAHRRAIELEPNVGLFHANLAGDLFQLNQLEQARKEARIALDLGFRDHWVFEKLGLSRTR